MKENSAELNTPQIPSYLFHCLSNTSTYICIDFIMNAHEKKKLLTFFALPCSLLLFLPK